MVEKAQKIPQQAGGKSGEVEESFFRETVTEK